VDDEEESKSEMMAALFLKSKMTQPDFPEPDAESDPSMSTIPPLNINVNDAL